MIELPACRMALIWVLAATAQAASLDAALPAYTPQAFELPRQAPYLTPQGAVRVVGYNDMREMLSAMAAHFAQSHAGLRFEFDLQGTRFAPAALASGASAFAPMGAEFTPPQLADYRARTAHEPLVIRVAHASLLPQALSGPLAVFVHRDNPLPALTMADVGRVFAGRVQDWAELGVQGSAAASGLRLIGMRPDTALALAMQAAALPGRSFAPAMRGLAQSAEVVEQVAADRGAIGFAAAMRATPGVRIVPIVPVMPASAHQAVLPTEDSIVDGSYPLARHLLICVARPLPPVAREFLRFVLSRDGQALVAASTLGYMALSARDAAQERAKLD